MLPMQVFKVRQEWYTTISAVKVTVLDVSGLMDIKVAERIQLRRLVLILLSEPNLVRAKDVLVQKARLMGGENELSLCRLTLGQLRDDLLDQYGMKATFNLIYQHGTITAQYEI